MLDHTATLYALWVQWIPTQTLGLRGCCRQVRVALPREGAAVSAPTWGGVRTLVGHERQIPGAAACRR